MHGNCELLTVYLSSTVIAFFSHQRNVVKFLLSAVGDGPCRGVGKDDWYCVVRALGSRVTDY